MNAGVGTSPCAVWTTPERASPSVAVSVNRSLIEAQVASVDDLVRAVLEAELLVVPADPGIRPQAVETKIRPPLLGGRRVGPLDDCVPDPLTGARAADRELVDVRSVPRPRAPVKLVIPQQRHRGDDVAAELRHVDLAALDRGSDLLPRERPWPLLVPACGDPGGRLVEQRGHRGRVT